MTPDSLAVFNVNLPAGALPWQILAILLVGFFAVFIVLVRQASKFKAYASEPPFPTHAATVIVALLLAIGTAPIELSRVALGLPMPNGNGDWLTFVAALAGVTLGGLAVNRFTSPEYQEGKAKVEAARQAVSPPQVNVAGDATVNASGQAAPESKIPQAGVAPKDPAVKHGLEQLSTKVAFGGKSND